MKDIIINDDYKKVTLKNLANLEEKYNLDLEEKYKNFLLNKNGGYINLNYVFYLDENDKDNYLHTVEFYSFKRLKDVLKINLKNKNDEYSIGYLLLKNNMLNIGQSNLGFELCLSYLKENFGKIYYVDDPHESEFVFLANSFDEFINGFEICPERLF